LGIVGTFRMHFIFFIYPNYNRLGGEKNGMVPFY
jgi:hypothetical protein